MKNISSTLLRESRFHGTDAFPCALYQSEALPSFFVKHHWHEELEILFFERGHYHLEINMEKYEIIETCFCFITSGDLHSISAQNDFSEKALVFSPAILSFSNQDIAQNQIIMPLIKGELAFPRFLTAKHPCFPFVREEFEKIIAAFSLPFTENKNQEHLTTNLPAAHFRIKASLLNIISFFVEYDLLTHPIPNSEPRIELIKEVLVYMKEHYHQKIYIHDLAQIAHMNDQYFIRFFKKMIGRSPMEYVNDLRIKHAAFLLKDTTLSVTEVCAESGFHNLGNFLSAFKKATGCTPLQYRASKKS